MNPRQFFTGHFWWGKILGLFFGYLMSGAAGAVFGLLIGNLFDRGFAEHMSRPHLRFNSEKRQSTQNIFFKATFIVMGQIAKADGVVSAQEIKMAKTLMQEMRLSKEQEAQAQKYYNEGKQNGYDIWHILSLLRNASGNNNALLKLFIDIQYRAAKVDGLTSEKINLLNNMLKFLGFVPLQEQYKFYEDFNRDTTNQNNYNKQYQQSQNTYQRPQSPIAHAYAILGIPEHSSQKEVKKSYRRMVSRNHPDKLIAQGLPEEMIRIAKEKTQQIIKAYEQICAAKGW